MARLSELTDPAAIEQALAEFRTLGRQEFLDRYNLEQSRDYFVQVRDELFDSKPILAVAYKYQHPEHGTLSVSEFSGGTGGTVSTLHRLGYKTATRSQLQPPALGDEYENRTAIYNVYGGNKMAGIIRFPGDRIANVFSDATGPYADDPPRSVGSFGYRGEGLHGPQRVDRGGNKLLEDARLTRSAVRFWHKPAGSTFVFRTWVAILGYGWVQGTDIAGRSRQEIEWQMEPVPGPGEQSWPSSVRGAIDDSGAPPEDAAQVPPEARPRVSYEELLRRINELTSTAGTNEVARTNYRRSAAIRRAVLVRSGGKCESPRCTGMPAETNRRGEPILDVDHIDDLGRGGKDHPANMAALCPNCHACKTRGAEAVRWRRELRAAATRSHEAALSRQGPG